MIWPFAIVGGLVAANLLSVANAGKNLIYNITGYSIKKGKLITRFQITNPTSETLYINYIFLDLLANGTAIGQTRQQNLQKEFVIRGDATNTFDIESTVVVPQALTTLATLALQAKGLPQLELKGYIKVNEMRLPFSQPVSFFS
jgi:LEA14-like dessication related protein